MSRCEPRPVPLVRAKMASSDVNKLGPVKPPPVDPTGPVGPPPAAAKVKIVLVAEPAEARWFLDDQPLGCNPCDVEKPKGEKHVAVAKAAGFTEQRVELAFEQDDTRNLALVAHLTIECARRRKESRGLHYTIDYPKKDERFLADTILRRGDGPEPT